MASRRFLAILQAVEDGISWPNILTAYGTSRKALSARLLREGYVELSDAMLEATSANVVSDVERTREREQRLIERVRPFRRPPWYAHALCGILTGFWDGSEADRAETCGWCPVADHCPERHDRRGGTQCVHHVMQSWPAGRDCPCMAVAS